MNKMAKGALATGVGVALLLGGGGTLAVWNQSVSANAGTIAAGDLNLQTEKGVWTSNISGQVGNIANYKIVPGEKLTYTQNVDVTLAGNNIAANLTVTGAGANGATAFKAENIEVGTVTLKKGSAEVQNPLKTSVEDVQASVTFEFLGTTTARDSTNATYDFSQVGFKLEQVAPTPAP
ncbi:MAG: alternate-type signal peptide domain-containing protein [Arthrobacter sp.]